MAMLHVALWSHIQKNQSSGAPSAPESGVKLEDGTQDIKPVLAPPHVAPPQGPSSAVGDEISTRGDTTGQSAPRAPTPEPPRVLYDPTLYPHTDPVVPKRGRARALDFESVDDLPTKKRRIEPPPKSAAISAPPPQPKKTTLFTANKSGPITRTRDGKYVPVPTLPKPRKWGLGSEKRAELGLEPLVMNEISGEPRSGDGESSISTARNPVCHGRLQTSRLLIDNDNPHGSQMQAPQQRTSQELRIRILSLKITRKMKVVRFWVLTIGTCALYCVLSSILIIPVHRTHHRSRHPLQCGLAHLFFTRLKMEKTCVPALMDLSYPCSSPLGFSFLCHLAS